MVEDVEVFWGIAVAAAVLLALAVWPSWSYTRRIWPYSRGLRAYASSALAALVLLLVAWMVWSSFVVSTALR